MLKKILLIIVAIFVSGCSTMLSPEKTSVHIKSTKDGQPFIVKNSEGKIIVKAYTPAVVELDNKGNSSYTYITQCEKKLEKSEINEWVLGNIITVSISGMLIDVANGYSNQPADEVSLLNCDKVIAKKKLKIARVRACRNVAKHYDVSVYKYNDKKTKKTINHLKYTQDYLLEHCEKYVDIQPYIKRESTINEVYENYM